MRISTNTIYDSGISQMMSLQTDQVKLQQQISTGKRITSPADDPVAASQALQVSYEKGINTKFADTRKTAELKLNTLESSLSSVTTLITAAQSTLVAAGNATYSNQERANIATDLKGSLDALVGLANTKDASGNYLYAGFKTSIAPFTATATGATYNGDSNQQLLQVDAQRQMPVNATGDHVFQAGGNDIFATLSNIITLLNTPITNTATQATFSAGLSTAIGNLQTASDNVLNVRADVGSKLNEIDALNLSGTDRDLQYSKTLSNLQDLDYASALSDFSKNQTIIDAAQKSFMATTSLSLFKLM